MSNIKKNMTMQAKFNAMKNILEISTCKQNKIPEKELSKKTNEKKNEELRFTLRVPKKLVDKIDKKISENPVKISWNQFILQCIVKQMN